MSTDKVTTAKEKGQPIKAPKVEATDGLTGETKLNIGANGENLEYELDINHQIKQVELKMEQLQGQLMMLNDIKKQGIKLYATELEASKEESKNSNP